MEDVSFSIGSFYQAHCVDGNLEWISSSSFSLNRGPQFVLQQWHYDSVETNKIFESIRKGLNKSENEY